MKTCPHCQHLYTDSEIRCPECGGFYSKVLELIEQAAQAELQQTWQWRYQQFLQADDKKQAGRVLWQQMTGDFSTTTWFTLWVILAFVFALMVSVL